MNDFIELLSSVEDQVTIAITTICWAVELAGSKEVNQIVQGYYPTFIEYNFLTEGVPVEF